jgi:hypothetical protein
MVRDGVAVTPAACQPLQLIRGWRQRTFLLHMPTLNCNIYLTFSTGRNEPWLRRRITLQSCDERTLATDQAALHVRWVLPARPALGGQGLPLWLDDTWFMALENPAGDNVIENGAVTLKQYVGSTFALTPLALDTLLIGGGVTGAVRHVFDDYVASMRRPPRSLTLYNTWCHLRGNALTEDAMATTAREVRQALAPFGAVLDVFAIDDGWFNPQSIWQPDHSKLPTGLAGLRARIATNDMHLGLWLPLSGHSLDTGWGVSNGYEALQKYFCLSGQRYNAALRQQLATLISAGDIRYFKHDFNYFWCGQTGHGHFPSMQQSVAANVNVEGDVLAYESRLQSNLFLAITTGIWPSPWWLRYADVIWMGGSDHVYNRRLPATFGSSFEMNYRDGALYDLMVVQALPFPLSALMTHGIVDGRHTPYNMRDEPDEPWAHYVMNYLGRGTLMRELYLSPENLSARRWEILARGLRWARALDDCMARARFVLGDPRRGELFGYAGAAGRRAYFSLRNPGLANAEVPLGDAGASAGVWQIVYPYQEYVNATPAARLTVPSETVVQAQTADMRLPLVFGARAALAASAPEHTTYTIAYDNTQGGELVVTSPVTIVGLDGPGVIAKVSPTVWHCRLPGRPRAASHAAHSSVAVTNSTLTVAFTLPPDARGTCRVVLRGAHGLVAVRRNGVVLEPRSISGEGWRLLSVPLQSTNNVICIEPEMSPAQPVSADVYAVVERPLATARLTALHARLTPADPYARPYPLLHEIQRDAMCLATNVTIMPLAAPVAVHPPSALP